MKLSIFSMVLVLGQFFAFAASAQTAVTSAGKAPATQAPVVQTPAAAESAPSDSLDSSPFRYKITIVLPKGSSSTMISLAKKVTDLGASTDLGDLFKMSTLVEYQQVFTENFPAGSPRPAGFAELLKGISDLEDQIQARTDQQIKQVDAILENMKNRGLFKDRSADTNISISVLKGDTHTLQGLEGTNGISGANRVSAATTNAPSGFLSLPPQKP